MSGNKRPLIGRRELQALVASTDTFLRNPAPVEEDAVEATGLTLLPSPHARQMSTFPNPRRTVGQLSLPAPNNSVAVVIELNGRPVIGVDDMSFSASFTQARSNIIEKREGKEKEAAWARFQSKQANPVPDHGHHTRAAAGRRRAIYLHHQQLKDFNTRFRALPKEIREMIFPFAIVWDGKKAPGLIVGLRSKRDDPNHYLYQEALGAFYSNNTFVLTRKNSYTLNRVGGGVMLPVVWETIRNLAIKHEYMRPDNRGFYHLFIHRIPEASYPFSPCTKCDFLTITLAKNVRNLHLDFGDSYHCIMNTVEAICRLAIEDMHHLERLVLTLSNIRCIHSDGNMQRLINKINDSTRETGRLLSVGTRAFSTGPNMEDFASESWFWQASQPRRTLTWMDTWALRCAVDAAAAEALFGRRTFHGAASIQAALTQAASTQAASTQAASTQAASAEDDFTDSDPDENDFDEDDLM